MSFLILASLILASYPGRRGFTATESLVHRLLRERLPRCLGAGLAGYVPVGGPRSAGRTAASTASGTGVRRPAPRYQALVRSLTVAAVWDCGLPVM